jgi:hypothetical protein
MAIVKDTLRRFVAVRELLASQFHIIGISSTDRRWVHALTPHGDECVMFRVGGGKWHFFSFHHEWTGSGGSPVEAITGGLGDVIGTDGGLRSYCRQINRAPRCYTKDCVGLIAARQTVWNETHR